MNERLTIITADIEKYLKELEGLNVKTMGDLKEKKNFYSTSMLLLTIFNRVIDLSQELVLTKKTWNTSYLRRNFCYSEKGGHHK